MKRNDENRQKLRQFIARGGQFAKLSDNEEMRQGYCLYSVKDDLFYELSKALVAEDFKTMLIPQGPGKRLTLTGPQEVYRLNEDLMIYF